MEHVVSQVGQLSELIVNQTLAYMEIITANKQAYKPSLEDIMDKYYEIFRGKNQGKEENLLYSPDHSDADG